MMRLILPLILTLCPLAQATEFSLAEHCQNLLAQNTPHIASARALMNSSSFPSGHVTAPLPADTEAMERQLDLNLHDEIKSMGTGLSDAARFVRFLHNDADLQMRYFLKHQDPPRARFILNRQAHNLAVLLTLARQGLAKRKLVFSSELLSELFLITKKLAQIDPPDAAIDLTQFLLEQKSVTEPEKLELKQTRLMMRAVLSALRPNDSALYRAIETEFDEISALQPLAPEIRQAQLLSLLNGMFLPVEKLSAEQFEFLRAMATRLPRERVSNEKIQEGMQHLGEFFAEHFSELLAYDQSLFMTYLFTTENVGFNIERPN